MTFSQAYNYLTYLSIASVGLPLVVGLLKLKALNAVLRALFVFLLLSGISDIICVIYFDNVKLLNTFLNCFGVIETLFVLNLYRIKLRNKKVIPIFAGIFLLIAVSRFLIQNKYSMEDSIVTSSEAILIVLLSGVYFYRLINSDEIENSSENYFFWINFSFLLYFGSGLMLFAATEFINHAPVAIASILWSLHLFINITCNMLFATGIWKIQK